jgi:hypothetical protein
MLRSHGRRIGERSRTSEYRSGRHKFRPTRAAFAPVQRPLSQVCHRALPHDAHSGLCNVWYDDELSSLRQLPSAWCWHCLSCLTLNPVSELYPCRTCSSMVLSAPSGLVSMSVLLLFGWFGRASPALCSPPLLSVMLGSTVTGVHHRHVQCLGPSVFPGLCSQQLSWLGWEFVHGWYQHQHF